MKKLMATAILGMALAASPISVSVHAMGGDSDGAPAMKKNSDYDKAVAAVKAKDYNEAARLLLSVVEKEPKNADAYNYLGFSYRKLGSYDRSFEYYNIALKLDPKHKGAHNYIGHAYLETNDIAGAEKHLEALDDICTFGCTEYSDLKKAVAAAGGKTS